MVDHCNTRRLLATVVLVMVASVIPATGVDDRSVRSVAQCAFTLSSNITAGMPAGSSKFAVSAHDCCEYCASLPGCVAASFYAYYCHPYTTVLSTGSSSSAQVVSVALPTTTAAPPHTAPPPTTAPSRLALLQTCPESTTCSAGDVYICTTEVAELSKCSYDALTQRYVIVTNAGDALARKEYSDGSCSGAAMAQKLFPFTCEFDPALELSVVGSLVDWLPQVGTFQASGSQCTDALCEGCPNVAFSGMSETCIDGGTGSSSSASDSGVGATAVLLLCFPQDKLVAVLPYDSMSSCERRTPVLGAAWPVDRCYTRRPTTNTYYMNHCTPQK